MFTLIFLILFFGIFGKLIAVAFRASWGLMKVIFTIVFLPVILIGLFVSGCVAFALPILVIVGVVALIKGFTGAIV